MVRYLDKERELPLMGMLFDLMHENMAEAVPSGLAREWEKAKWLAEVVPALKKEPRQIVLLYCKGMLAGFCMYYINGGKLMVEEVQIRRAYQRTSVAAELFRFLKGILPPDTACIEAFADKRNLDSRRFMEKHGMVVIGETPDGTCVHYRGDARYIFK